MKFKTLFKPNTFKEKIFQAFLITSLVPILLLTLIAFFQTRTITTTAQQEARKDVLLQTERNITAHVDAFRHSLSLFTENSAFQSAWYDKNVSMFYRYLFFRDTFDPTINNIKTSNPTIQDILFFTDSSYAGYRANILSLEEMHSFPVNPDSLIPKNSHWVELNEDTLGIFGGFPGSVGFQTFVLISVKKADFFSVFYSTENRALGTVFENKKQLYPLEETEVMKNYQTVIPNTNWRLALSPSSVPDLSMSLIWITLSAVILAILIAYYFTRFFAKNIGKEITYLKQRVALALENDSPKKVILNQQDEFIEVSNEIGDMLEMVLTLKKESYQHHLDSKDREYHAMINQINSHFLYNTLSAVNWHAVLSGQEEISYAIQLLSKYYRTTLNKGQSAILLQDELDNVKTYIDLQLFLHPNRFQVFYHVDDSLLSTPIIHLLLQPIVENAIEHGFNHEKESQRLEISIQKDTDYSFLIKIEDNGIGFDLDKLSEIFITKTKGYGLRNIDQRIKFYFGEEYGLLFDSEEGVGTIVTIHLPLPE